MKKTCPVHLGFFVIVFSLTFGGCEKSVSTFPAKQFKKIVFLSNRESDQRQFDIFMMAPDGREQTNLTRDIASIRTHSRPILSPAQDFIAFTAFEVQGPALQIMQLSDLAVTTLTQLTHDAPHPQFSPKGEKLVYVDKINDLRQIHLMNCDGSGKQNISKNDCDEFDPSFSPDGSRIVFISKCKNRYEIGTINLVQLERHMISVDEGVPGKPVFSPNGDYIAFASDRKGISDIFIIRNNGKGLKNLTQRKSYDVMPQFLPDGSRLVFVSNLRGHQYRDICVIDTRGKKLSNLTKQLNYFNQNPHITPDGKTIIFETNNFVDSEIYRVDIQTEKLTNLSNHPAWDQAPGI